MFGSVVSGKGSLVSDLSGESLQLSGENPGNLTSTELAMCKIVLRKAALQDVHGMSEFKSRMSNTLFTIEDSLSGNEKSFNFVKLLHNDLENCSAYEFAKKYFAAVGKEDKGIMGLLAPHFQEEAIGKRSRKDSEQQMTTISEQFKKEPMKRDGLLAMMMELQKEKLKQKQKTQLDNSVRDSDFHCYVVDKCDLNYCLEQLKQSAEKVEGVRVQLLVRSEFHYTAIDIGCRGKALQAAVMDAAKDERLIEIVNAFKRAGCKDLYVIGSKDRIQNDGYNCAYFGLDSICQSHKDRDFFTTLAQISQEKDQEEGCKNILWKDMPLQYIRNATSTTFMRDYFKNHPVIEKENILK